MTQTYQPEEKARLRRQLTDQAIQLALESRWEEAVVVNRELLSTAPRDLSTLNRLGKALGELGRYEEARQAYMQALEIEPTNNIARKNLDRLSQLVQSSTGAHPSQQRIDPRLFIEETGKTTFTQPVEVSRQVLAHLNPGDQVFLRRDGNALLVQNAAGEQAGRLEPRLANRLIRFMEAGNQYAAGVTEVTNSAFRIIIRETFQHPSMFGRVSFPAQGGETMRGYIKGSMLRYDHEEEEEFGEESEYYDGDESGDDDEKEPDFEDIGFSETEE